MNEAVASNIAEISWEVIKTILWVLAIIAICQTAIVFAMLNSRRDHRQLDQTADDHAIQRALAITEQGTRQVRQELCSEHLYELILAAMRECGLRPQRDRPEAESELEPEKGNK